MINVLTKFCKSDVSIWQVVETIIFKKKKKKEVEAVWISVVYLG